MQPQQPTPVCSVFPDVSGFLTGFLASGKVRGLGVGPPAPSVLPSSVRCRLRAWGLVCSCVHSKIESSSPWFLALGKLLFDFFKLQYLYDYYNNKVRFGFYSPVQGQPSFSALPLLKSFLGDLKS